MNSDQLEINFDKRLRRSSLKRALRRPRRAAWWFGQMHRVVDTALDWRPAPPARPEQTYFTLAAWR